MKVIDAVKICGEILELNLDESIFADADSALKNANVGRLVRCCNSVLEELYRAEPCARRNTHVQAKDGNIDTSCLRMCKAVSLYDVSGVKVSFRYGQNGLLVENDGDYVLCYALLPETVGLKDEVILPSVRITDRIFIYGVVKEYCFEIGDLTCYETWNGKYRDALSVALTKTAFKVMPTGRWS